MIFYKYKMLFSYDGTNYSGWQVQPNAVSIQEMVEKALKTYLKQEIRIIASSRTDAGVHALAHPAHFKVPFAVNQFQFLRAMNGMLPWDIRVMSIEAVPLDFHAQYSAQSKIYHYNLFLEPVIPPFRKKYAWHFFTNIDLSILQAACQMFVGTHDFTAFSNETCQNNKYKDPVRTLKRVDVVPEEGGVRIEFEGNGFLYKMVRNIVGTCVEAASGRRDLHAIPLILASKDRRQAGRAAPPHGLFLVSVQY